MYQGSRDKRKKGGQTEEKWNENLRKELKLNNVNIAFLDASYGEENIEKAKIEEQLHKIFIQRAGYFQKYFARILIC